MRILFLFVAGGVLIEFVAAMKASKRTGRSVFASSIVDAWTESILGVKVPVLAGLWAVVSIFLWIAFGL